MSTPEFIPFTKIPRWKREVLISEKIDGTNASVYVPVDSAEPLVFGSRNRWLLPGETDNFGFRNWGEQNAEQLRAELGHGRHYGEWFGSGIQRGYGLAEKRFILFNTARHANTKLELCSVVPLLYAGIMDEAKIEECLANLALCGSVAVPGFKDPEGIVIFHCASKTMFKKLIKGDELPKGTAA